MFRMTLATILLLAAYPAASEEVTSPPILLHGGIICDTLDDAIAAVERQPAPTCGRLVQPSPGTVTPLVEYTAHGMVFQMVRYDFLRPSNFPAVQYGWFGQPKPVPASLQLGEEA